MINDEKNRFLIVYNSAPLCIEYHIAHTFEDTMKKAQEVVGDIDRTQGSYAELSDTVKVFLIEKETIKELKIGTKWFDEPITINSKKRHVVSLGDY